MYEGDLIPNARYSRQVSVVYACVALNTRQEIARSVRISFSARKSTEPANPSLFES